MLFELCETESIVKHCTISLITKDDDKYFSNMSYVNLSLRHCTLKSNHSKFCFDHTHEQTKKKRIKKIVIVRKQNRCNVVYIEIFGF